MPEQPNETGDGSQTKLTAEQIERYEKLYNRGWRTLYRWVEKGKEVSDPCPLHDPRALLNWWAKHNPRRKVPAEIEQACVQASIAEREDIPAPVTPSTAPTPPSPSLKAAAPASVNAAIHLEEIDPEEGDRLRELKQLQAAKFDQLRKALASGHDTTSLETKYLSLCETIDKIESRAIERMKKRGLFILREDVDRDLAKNAELLRQTRESMERQVLELCASLNSDQRTEVSAAIFRVRARQDALFSKLDCLKGDDLLRELNAA